MLLSVVFVFTLFMPAYAEQASVQFPKTVKVGWYQKDGFQETNSHDLKSGYGYEFLQELARYGGWDYEYTEGTFEECLQMLERGEIDLLGGVTYTPELATRFDFAKYAINENYTVLVTNETDERYKKDDFGSFNDMKVGVLRNDVRLDWLYAFAQENDFSFIPVEYASANELALALNDNEVDAVLKSHMDIADHGEKMIAQFPPGSSYFVVQKGNAVMLDAINYALDQALWRNPNFKLQLDQKYLRGHKGHNVALSSEEQDCVDRNPVIRIAVNSFRKPMLYKENGELKGITADILKRVHTLLGVTFEYVETANVLESITLVESGGADMLSNIYYDFGWAEENGLLLSQPYMELDYAAITRIGDTPKEENLRVAAVRGYLFSQNYIEEKYDESQITWYDSEEECVIAVRENKQDICFTNTYVANTYIQDYEYKGLYSSIINYSHGLSLGVPKSDEASVLLSAIDKAIIHLNTDEVYSIIAENTMMEQHTMSFMEMVQTYPILFVILGAVSVALVAMIIILKTNRKKDQEIYRARLAAERDSITGLYNRLSYELTVEEFLRTGQAGKSAAFVMIDIDDFKTVNDTKGHSYGDQMLCALADTLYEKLNSKAILSRMGGDEFSVFLPDTDSREQVLHTIEVLHQALRNGTNGHMEIACSIGIAFWPEHGRTFEELYKSADSALYEAKNAGKNKIVVKES